MDILEILSDNEIDTGSTGTQQIKEKTVFRFTYKKDLALVTEATARKPYLVKGKDERNIWQDIAEVLEKEFGGNCTSRCARERLKKIRADVRKEDFTSRYKSGTEEEYNDLKRMILELDTAIRDHQSVSAEQGQQKVKKIDKEKEIADEIRDAAMTSHVERKAEGESEKVARKRSSETPYLDVWKEKIDKDNETKSKELERQTEQRNLDRDLQRDQLELERERLQFEKAKYEDEKMERSQRFEMEKQERIAQLQSNQMLLQIISNLANNTAGASLKK